MLTIIICILLFFGIATIAPTADFVGSVGELLGNLNFKLFGLIAYVYPFLLIILSYLFYKKHNKFDSELAQSLLGFFLFFIAILMLQSITTSIANSGEVGNFINDALRDIIGTFGTCIVILMMFVISVGLIFRDNIIVVLRRAFVDPTVNLKFKNQEQKTSQKQTIERKKLKEISNTKDDIKTYVDEQVIEQIEISNTDEADTQINLEPDINSELDEPSINRKLKIQGVEILNEVVENKKLLEEIEKGKIEKPKNFELPSLKFLKDPPKRSTHINEAEIDQKISDLLDKLRKFKIDGDVVRTYTGPIVTTFEFRPAPHIKVSKILTLQDDLAMALRAQTIRIQAPIPGKDVVGIEVPNTNTETIYLKEILDSEIFKNAKSPLTMALGKDIVGAPFITDLKKLPHLLIAGTTGSGKSVGINAMLLSLLYRNSPQTLRLMMIDPKMLEFSIYNDIPHLLIPVITQAKQAITALSNMVAEMERRYTIMSHTRTKNIESYNEKMKAEGGEQFPYIVVIIDELADLMMTSGKDVELYIGRLAQMARASGIHLIVATQRPSVDVVTGLIKANLPSRISYRVGQRIDSKVILDQMGAESLLGRGDMLFTPPGSPGIIRLHAPFASEKEIESIVEFLKSQQEVVYDERFLAEAGSSGENSEATLNAGELDPLYEEAKAIILSEQKTSISYLQRRLSIGYNRSANILEQLEKMGILSPLNAKGQREIL
ncbi:DNA translocase FtsK 4TM domain-containing protein [Campylobacter sp. RM9344]|uniref:DNA translocase FtsK 4TM domain-containing protein n=1 Tax=Campylobacter californiensis TaxID=1032243 RepID=A0AAW3ZTB9_9BACT|nr:DNA translocase FtsK 4TM domain-containing protein [Campylobacter sp. RM6883]MBE2994896.1 DNA translocase FtsK 4TM domain-containing protein [Campylobacter sp. RM6913]MBE3029466.1 DNA translocase FtsK 4TM domain-containing protein [Campylobacter sp. RM9344]MBE3608027.1 DNA translocase FtsK 4TM domain-containing protein [Campylobacter sp. RM9337]